MSAELLLATIAMPAEAGDPNFDAARKRLSQQQDAAAFRFQDPEQEMASVLPDWMDMVDVVDDQGLPLIGFAKQAGEIILDELAALLTEPDGTLVETMIGGHRVWIAGGLSYGDSPSPAADAIWNAHCLPQEVLAAAGFVSDASEPPARRRGARRGVTDTDVVDAIALGLGTKAEWEGPDDLTWIADTLALVRAHPGDVPDYRRAFSEETGFDPEASSFLRQYLSDSEEE